MSDDWTRWLLLNKGEKYRIKLYTHYRYPDCKMVNIVGHDVGPRPTFVKFEDRGDEHFIIVRNAGHKTFHSRGEQIYIPTQYWRLKMLTTEGDVILVEMVDGISPGRNKRAIYEFLA